MTSNFQASSSAEETKPLVKSADVGKPHLHRSKRFYLIDHDCLNVMYKDKLLCDVVLIAEGMEVPAHKFMLASCSPFFYWKFSKDRYLRVLNRIEIQNLTYDTLSAVINYLYKCEILITEQNVGELSTAAYLFALKDLQAACRDFLDANLNIKNCLRTKRIAKQCQYEETVAIANDVMIGRYSEFVKQDGFLDMDHEEVVDLIEADSLAASDEEEVLDSVIRWINYHNEHRKQHGFKLLDKVRFSLISQSKILQRLEREEWLKSDPQYDSILLKALTCNITDSLLKLPKQRRYSSKCLMVVGATDEWVLDMELYDLEKDIWLRKPDVPLIDFTKGTSAAIVGSTIYIVHDQLLKYFNVGDSAQNEWLQCCKLLEDKKYFGMVACNDVIYIVGGYNNKFVSSVHRIDVSSGECEEISSMSEAKRFVGSGVLQGNLYIVGGSKSVSGSLVHLNSVECYRSDINTWFTLPSMSIERSETGVASLGDTLYVVGGWDGYNACKQVEAFNPAQLSWKKLTDMNIARYTPGVIAVNGQLFVFGGHDGQSCLTSAEVYNPDSDTWTMLPSKMNKGKQFVSVGLVDKATMKI